MVLVQYEGAVYRLVSPAILAGAKHKRSEHTVPTRNHLYWQAQAKKRKTKQTKTKAVENCSLSIFHGSDPCWRRLIGNQLTRPQSSSHRRYSAWRDGYRERERKVILVPLLFHLARCRELHEDDCGRVRGINASLYDVLMLMTLLRSLHSSLFIIY